MSASPTSEAPPSEAHLLGEWARLIFETLRQAGVTDVWVSPGSRSTPFTWVAQKTPGLTLRAVIDERSAAFLALGHARVTGRPSALLCTSGTAAANYFPAVVEAAQAHLPLLVLTADRPLDVQHAAAAQTIDQLKLYGDYARRFYDLGLPDAAPSALSGARRAVTQAVAETRGPLPGPVHVNLRAKKPLEPTPATNHAEKALEARVDALLASPLARYAPEQVLANDAVLATARTLSEAASSVLVVGPLPAWTPSLGGAIAQLSKLTSSPVFAEAGSQLRFDTHELAFPLFDWLLSSPELAPRLAPEVVVCIGQTPTSSAYERWLAHIPRRIVLAPYGFPDAAGNASLVASGDLQQGLASLVAELSRLALRPRKAEWLQELQAQHQRAESAVARALELRTPELSEGLAVKSVVEAMPPGSVLALGNSLPIRDVDAYVTRRAPLTVTVQRGANGIDGLVAGAIGSALGSTKPTLLLLGDVSFLHDLGSLASLGLLQTPLTIAVVDNAGGRIFDQLPVAELYGHTDAARLWRTPTGIDLAQAARLFGLRYVAPTTPAAIAEATARGLFSREPTLLHLRVGPTSASELRKTVLQSLRSAPRESRD